MNIRQLTPEEIKQCRLQVWILVTILFWTIITGPVTLIWNYIVTQLTDAPTLSPTQITGLVAAYCMLDLYINGWKKNTNGNKS